MSASTPSNLNILVEAKNEYLVTLHRVMCPSMIDTFRLLYAEALKLSKGRKVMVKTQALLREVNHWNHHMIKEHTETIVNGCAWFNEIIAAVFVGFIKILSSVRINNNNQKFATKVPNTDLFVHRCYVSSAKDLYEDPYILQRDDFDSYQTLYNRISECIDSTIRDLIPMQQILDTYMSSSNVEETQPDDDDEEDGEEEDDDPVLFDDLDKSETPDEPKDISLNSSSTTEPTTTEPTATEPTATQPPPPAPTPESQPPVLFPDAPEQ